MTKSDRVRDGGTETEREAKKKRNLPPSPSPSGEGHPPFCEPDDPQELQVHPPCCEPGDQAAPQQARPEKRGDRDEMTQSHGAVEEEEELSTFTTKSPISKPYIPEELADQAAHPDILAAFEDAQARYNAKLRRRAALVTCEYKRKEAPSCLFHHEHLHPIRERAKKAVLRAAKSTIRLSSYSVEGEPLTSCCGLWTDWDKESKTGTILTAAHLIRSKHPTKNHWKGRDEYDVNAKVTVHLRDGTTAEGQLIYHQEHYDIAFFKVKVNESVQYPSFNGNIHSGQDVFRLGRDENMDLRITHGRVEYWNPASYERYHYMYFLHEDDEYRCDDDGGPVIDLDGKVVGLMMEAPSFVPSSILDKCVDLWRKFMCIPRLHLGMKFASISFLDPINIEKIWRMHNIEDGLIVEKVSKESNAEKHGICFGDIVECFNGQHISNTIELENMLLDKCKDHFDQGKKLNDKVDVSIQVFHTDEQHRRIINLNVEVSDHGEIIRKSEPHSSINNLLRLNYSVLNQAWQYSVSPCKADTINALTPSLLQKGRMLRCNLAKMWQVLNVLPPVELGSTESRISLSLAVFPRVGQL